MANKYEKESEEAQKRVREERLQYKSCLSKVSFKTEAEAYQKGQKTYKCNYCERWHRASGIESLIGRLKRIKKRH